MTKKIESTYDRFIKSLSPTEKKDYEREREAFLLSEMVLAAIAQDYQAVKELAQMAGIAPEIIQDLVPKAKNKFDTQVFLRTLRRLGYRLILEKSNSRVPLTAED